MAARATRDPRRVIELAWLGVSVVLIFIGFWLLWGAVAQAWSDYRKDAR